MTAFRHEESPRRGKEHAEKTLATIAALLLLAGCAHDGWTKPGTEAGAVAAARQQCQEAAERAVGPEERIDQDILATRQTDWQRSPTGGIAAGELGAETHERAEKIVAACMRDNGFVPAKQP